MASCLTEPTVAPNSAAVWAAADMNVAAVLAQHITLVDTMLFQQLQTTHFGLESPHGMPMGPLLELIQRSEKDTLGRLEQFVTVLEHLLEMGNMNGIFGITEGLLQAELKPLRPLLGAMSPDRQFVWSRILSLTNGKNDNEQYRIALTSARAAGQPYTPYFALHVTNLLAAVADAGAGSHRCQEHIQTVMAFHPSQRPRAQIHMNPTVYAMVHSLPAMQLQMLKQMAKTQAKVAKRALKKRDKARRGGGADEGAMAARRATTSISGPTISGPTISGPTNTYSAFRAPRPTPPPRKSPVRPGMGAPPPKPGARPSPKPRARPPRTRTAMPVLTGVRPPPPSSAAAGGPPPLPPDLDDDDLADDMRAAPVARASPQVRPGPGSRAPAPTTRAPAPSARVPGNATRAVPPPRTGTPRRTTTHAARPAPPQRTSPGPPVSRRPPNRPPPTKAVPPPPSGRFPSAVPPPATSPRPVTSPRPARIPPPTMAPPPTAATAGPPATPPPPPVPPSAAPTAPAPPSAAAAPAAPPPPPPEPTASAGGLTPDALAAARQKAKERSAARAAQGPSPEELRRQTEEAEGVGIAAALVRALANRRGAVRDSIMPSDDSDDTDDSWD